jgi:hypothetical protein
MEQIRRNYLEHHLTKYTVDLIRHLVKTEQAKNGVINFMSQVMHCSKEDALKYYKEYKKDL